MNIIIKAYTMTITWQGQSQTFDYNLSHDGNLSEEEIHQTIVNDFYSNLSLEIDLPPCCPICSSHTFDGCPACENYL